MPTSAVNNGMIYTTTDTTLEKRDISELIELMDPFDVPLLDMVGQNSLHSPCTQTKHEWIQDYLIPNQGTLASAYVAGSGTITLASGEGKYLVVNDMILIGDVVFRITNIPSGSDVLSVTVIRGTDASAASGSIWRKISHSAPEGGVAEANTRTTTADVPYNFTQIIKDWLIITGTMAVIPRYDYVSERAYNEDKLMKQLSIDLERSLLYGIRSEVAGPPRQGTMGGLFEFVYLAGVEDSWEQVHDADDGELTETMVNDVLQRMWELGAAPDFILVNGTNKRRISTWAKPYIRTERTENTVGAAVAYIESDFGVLDVLLNRHLRPSDVIIGTRGQLGIGPLNGRAFSSRMLPATLDGEWLEVLGEYTMEVHRPSVDFGWIYNTKSTF